MSTCLGTNRGCELLLLIYSVCGSGLCAPDTQHSNIMTLRFAPADSEVDRRLYISCHKERAFLFNTRIHPAQAAVCMLNRPSQLKTLFQGSKFFDSHLLLTSNPDKRLATTFKSACAKWEKCSSHHFNSSARLVCQEIPPKIWWKTSRRVTPSVCCIFLHM